MVLEKEIITMSEFKNKVFIIGTDTVYGISALIDDRESVERIRKIKKRGSDMGFIVLIPNIQSMNNLGIRLTTQQKNFLEKVWPGRVSVVVGDTSERFNYLKGKNESIAFRVPDNETLRIFLEENGPIVSTSANIHGDAVVNTIEDAKDIFGGVIDEYIDSGKLDGTPSTLIKILR